jgi:hypothetical protein
MKRMRIYQTNQHPIKISKKLIQKKSSNLTDEITEQDSTSYDELSINNHDNRSNHFLSRVRQTFQNHDLFNDQNTIQLTEHQQYLKSQSHTERRFHRSRKLLICIAALFTISWLPLTITQIYLEHNEDILYTRDGANFVYGYLLIPCYLISSLSAWINPVIYNYINRSFRREFYALYSCCFNVSSSSSSSSLSFNSRKELTLIDKKRYRRETNQSYVMNASSSRHSTGKLGAPMVSFADETTVMMHEQT